MPQLELRPARCRVTTGHGKKIPLFFLLATLSVTSVQIEHAVHLVVLLSSHKPNECVSKHPIVGILARISLLYHVLWVQEIVYSPNLTF